MVELLIASGAEVDIGNDYGDTPLDYMEGGEIFTNLLANFGRR